jgi:hypothetical protein
VIGSIIITVFCIAWCLQSQEIAQKRRQNEAENRAFLRHRLRDLKDPRYTGAGAPPHPYRDQIMQDIGHLTQRTPNGARVLVDLIEQGNSIERAIKKTRRYSVYRAQA